MIPGKNITAILVQRTSTLKKRMFGMRNDPYEPKLQRNE